MPFDFNLYSSLLLPPVFHGLLYSFLLFIRSKRESRRSDGLLAVIILLLTFRVANWMLGFAGWYDSHDSYSTFMFYFPFNWGYFFGPLAFMYFLQVVYPDRQVKRTDWFHFILPIVWVIYELVVGVADLLIIPAVTGSPLPHHWNTQGELALNGFPVITDILNAGSLLSPLVYGVLIYKRYQNYRVYVAENFSFDEVISLKWIRNLLVGLAAGLLIWLVFSIANLLMDIGYVTAWYSYAGWGLVIYFISIAGYHSVLPSHIRVKFNPVISSASPSPPTFTEDEQKIREIVESKRLFLNPELTILHLAEAAQLPVYRVSAALNNKSGLNFSRFINEYRVRWFQQLVASGEFNHLNIMGLALESGFRSKATFNRVYREITGQTPSYVLSEATNTSQKS